VTHLTVNDIELVLEDIEMPYPYSIIVHGYEFKRVGIEVGEVLAALIWLVRGYLTPLALSLTHVPHDHKVSIDFTAK
jgi:hypothetical protein